MAKYNCKTCGAELYFNPAIGQLQCEYCGSTFDPAEYNYTPEGQGAQDGGAVQEAAYVDGPVTEASTDDATGELVIYKCPHWGAEDIN